MPRPVASSRPANRASSRRTDEDIVDAEVVDDEDDKDKK